MPGPSRQERALGGRKYLNVKFEPKPSIECDSKKVGLSAEFDSYTTSSLVKEEIHKKGFPDEVAPISHEMFFGR